jgi:hypothetical protein
MMEKNFHTKFLKRTLNSMVLVLQTRFLMMLMHILCRRKSGNHVSTMERLITLKIISLRGIMIFLNTITKALNKNKFILLHIQFSQVNPSCLL